MNKFQNLFSTDGRVIYHKPSTLVILSLCYSIFDWRQIRYIAKWNRSLKKGSNPLQDESPWVTYRAISKLEKILTKESIVFEYGSGGSTLFFASRCKKIVSVEHDKEWYQKLKSKLAEMNINNCEYLFEPPVKYKNSSESVNDSFRSRNMPDSSFENYVRAIDKYPDNYFDLVSVDGRSRIACVREAFSKVKNNGYILLDNSDRRDYYDAHLFLRSKGAMPEHFFGLVGYEPPLAQTSIWKINK